MPRVTVVVPTYNRADLIAQTLESVEAQTFTDWECLVVDDGSTDNTLEVVAEFMARDGRFRYVRQENSSASKARNRGLELARGEYVAFLDSDDLYLPDKLEWQVAALDAEPEAVLAYGLTFHFRNGDTRDGHVYQGDRPDRPSGWAFDRLIQCSSIYAPLVRTERIRARGGFDTSLPSAEDWDMWLSLSRVGKIVFQPKVALYYRVHPGNKSGNLLRNYRCARRVVRKHLRGVFLLKRIRLGLGAQSYFRRVYTRGLLGEAYRLSAGHDWPRAREAWLAVLQLDPRLARRPSVLAHGGWALVSKKALPVWYGWRRRTRMRGQTDVA